jgi:hypothetical protein
MSNLRSPSIGPGHFPGQRLKLSPLSRPAWVVLYAGWPTLPTYNCVVCMSMRPPSILCYHNLAIRARQAERLCREGGAAAWAVPQPTTASAVVRRWRPIDIPLNWDKAEAAAASALRSATSVLEIELAPGSSRTWQKLAEWFPSSHGCIQFGSARRTDLSSSRRQTLCAPFPNRSV